MARTEQQIRDAIDNLEAILDSGATETLRDGHMVKFDHDSARRRVTDLKNELADMCGNTRTNRIFYGLNLNGRSCN